MKKLYFLILFQIYYSLIFADTILTIDRTYQGRILSANKQAVVFETGKRIITLDKSKILSYTFSKSDMLVFKSGKNVKCKVIGILKGYVVYVTSQKAFKQKEGKITKIKSNIGSELEIKSLPFTANGFKPVPFHIEIESNNNTRFIYFKIPVMGLLNSSLSNWKKQFTTKAGNHPDTKGYPIGGEAGLALNNNFSLGIGYEYFYYPQISIVDNLSNLTGETYVSCSFPYMNLKFNIFQNSNYCFYTSADFGLLLANYNLKIPYGTTINLNGQALANQIKFGLSFPITNKLEGSAEIGFLAAKIDQMKYHGKEIPQYNLDFSGINFSYSLRYIINF